MENVSTILKLLYKRVSSQSVLFGHVRWDNFSKSEFIRIAEAYIGGRSENELENLFNHLVSVCHKSALLENRHIPQTLNVFELLFYISGLFIDITNSEIRCRYLKLPQWRNLTVELSEDLFITAFLARKLSRDSVLRRGFTWPRIISHDNEHLHAVIGRGISENHSHINGAAPIFQVSWLSLMNHVENPAFPGRLRTYDVQRRYKNVRYSSEYDELPFLKRYLQAALIRLLIFSKLAKKRISVGRYDVRLGDVFARLQFPALLSGPVKEPVLERQVAENIKTALCGNDAGRDSYTYRDLLFCLLESCRSYGNGGGEGDFKEMLQISPAWNFFERSTLGKLSINTEVICTLCDQYTGALCGEFLKAAFPKDAVISLVCLEPLFCTHSEYVLLWEQVTLKNVCRMLEEPEKIEYAAGDIQSTIDGLRLDAQKMVSQMYGGVDYALSVLHRNQVKEEDCNFIFAGERWLMYHMFYALHNQIQSQNLDPAYIKLFYMYLLIKESVRSELVLSNSNVGFKNFQRYEKRKGDFLVDNIYRDVFIKTAVHDSFLSKNIKKMELRFPPDTKVTGNLKKISQMDKTLGGSGTLRTSSLERFFYTLHFIRKTEYPKDMADYFYCRHHWYRQQAMRRAFAIAGLREKYPLIGERVFGIDAASNEIGCRPEVFSLAFRYLKSHHYTYMTYEGPKDLPQLRATYHVGEDFLDVADGLRAIEESIRFLGLANGDRLGHALALGINVKQWYEDKHYKIMLPAQDYLDNLVWVYQKLAEYNIQGCEHLQNWIYSEFTLIFEQLYSKNCNGDKADLFNYYNAWKLRGDDPVLYADGKYRPEKMENKRQFYRVDQNDLELAGLRKIPEVSGLYFRYHFDEYVRRAGGLTTEYPLSKAYAGAVAKIQHYMQFDIASKGIAIETNPSSNYHIGTFRSYDQHPIVKFYNKGLVHNEQALKECAQIPVSINTDDQGVFSTSLENEYALMASALENVTDEDDRKLYNPSDIYEWLNDIRIMGNDQSFGEIYRRKHSGMAKEQGYET